jgi:hypothetical protein
MDALHGALNVLQKTKESLRWMQVVKKGEPIGTVRFRPNHVLSLQCTQSIGSIVWPQEELRLNVKLKQMPLPIRKGAILGTVTLEGGAAQEAPIAAAQSISAPSLLERLTRLYW